MGGTTTGGARLRRGIPTLLAGAAGLLVLLGPTVPSCGGQHFVGASADAPTLQFLGDSITALAMDAIDAHYEPNYQVAIDAVGGATTYTQQRALAREAALVPDIEVINLGTNDVGCIRPECIGDGATTFSADIVNARLDRFAAAFPASTCVVFVTINSHNPSHNPAGAQALNDHLRATSSHLADWDAVSSPTWFDTADNPHPNGAGQAALIALMDQAIATCPPRASAGTSTTAGPTTEVPTTEVPITEVPITEVPTTEVPITEVPTSEVPTTEPATTVPGADSSP